MNKKVIITGASGMIGGILLNLCINDDSISEIISLVRKPSGINHNKLKEIVISDFLNYDDCSSYFSDADVVFYCLGVYTGAAAADLFRKITVDYPIALAKSVYAKSPNARFCLLSGQGADNSENSKVMFARDKGAAENALSKIGFASFISFRPSYIYPVEKRIEPNVMYKIMRWLYPIIKLFGKNVSIESTALAKVIHFVGLHGASKSILENKDMRDIEIKISTK